jgi:hypothetical protein
MERDHLGDPGVDGRILLRWIFRKWVLGFRLDQAGSGWDRWWAFVNAVMNIPVPYNAGNFLTI